MMQEIMDAMPGAMKGGITKMPALPRHAKLSMMKGMILFMMPRLIPKAIELMKQAIPNMPLTMEAMLPEMLSEVMAAIMPPMLPVIATILAPKMTAYMEKQATK
jgi:hypothetical protein